ncbi:MAG: 3-hydroxyacyl-CoA dehydrogenase [Betaproteobacteria bacterium]
MSTAPFQRIGVVGSGVMGRGIAQIFALAGIPVRLYDSHPPALDAAIQSLAGVFSLLQEKGRLTEAQAESARARLLPAQHVAELADCDLVIEAIVEKLEAKRDLLASLDQVLSPSAVIASNTSSLSITAIAASSRHPERVAGYHFFNPVPLMRIVEVIGGPRTSAQVLERLSELARQAGHLPVQAQDTPGFIVNHAGRGFGTEALRLLGEGVSDPVTIDRIMREQVSINGSGFKLGPFELMDLTGLDVSHPVMESIYRQYYEEPRFRPSVIAAQRTVAGLHGRKRGEGWYRHVDGKQQTPPEAAPPAVPDLPPVWVAPGEHHSALVQLITDLGARVESTAQPGAESLVLLAPLGHDATSACHQWPAERAIAIDTLFGFGKGQCQRRTLMTTPATHRAYRDAAHALFAADGVRVSVIRDSAGFVAPRILAMIVAIGCEIAQQRIATPADIDSAVRLGLGYPAGPLSLGDLLGPSRVTRLLDEMSQVTGDPRYRPSLWLRRRAQLGLSLLHAD